MSRKHVLVAESEPYARITLSLILKKAGFQVTTVEDGRSVLEKLSACVEGEPSVDLLLTDIQMPWISGMELIDELIRRHIHLPVLVISDSKSRAVRAALMSRGIETYIEKPFDSEELIERVSFLISGTKNAKSTR